MVGATDVLRSCVWSCLVLLRFRLLSPFRSGLRMVWLVFAVGYLKRERNHGGTIHGCSWRKARLGRRAAPFGTGGTSHDGGAERILASQGGISHGQRSRNRWELGWLQAAGNNVSIGGGSIVLHQGGISHGLRSRV